MAVVSGTSFTCSKVSHFDMSSDSCHRYVSVQLQHVSPKCVLREGYTVSQVQFEQYLIRLSKLNMAQYHERLTNLIRSLENEITQRQLLHERCIQNLNSQADIMLIRQLPEMERLNRENDRWTSRLVKIVRWMFVLWHPPYSMSFSSYCRTDPSRIQCIRLYTYTNFKPISM